MPQSAIHALNEYIRSKGLRYSKQREMIASEFFASKGHIRVEDLFQKVQKKDSKIGIATVYRTLNLLQDSGLAVRRDFETRDVTYEKAYQKHHDHLICTQCGKIEEFEEEKIEKLQETVAERFGFQLMSHKMELYGLCKSCIK